MYVINLFVIFSGDSAYPLEPWLMKVYRDPQTAAEKMFNKMLCKARFLVENAIGLLKNWCRLMNLENRPHYEAETVGTKIHRSHIINFSYALINYSICF